MRLTVLGSSGSHPAPGRACSAYLLEHDGHLLQLDCGNGSMGNLLRHAAVADLGALVVTHRHPDHWADLVGMAVSLRYGARAGVLDVHAPTDAITTFGTLLGEGVDGALRLHPIAAGDRIVVGPFRIDCFQARHQVPTLALRVEADGAVVAYSGDSDTTPVLDDVARDADLFVADCTWTDAPDRPDGVHMSGLAAGRHAASAGARRLLVTHVWPETDPEAVAAEARTTFDGEVLVAVDGMVVEL